MRRRSPLAPLFQRGGPEPASPKLAQLLRKRILKRLLALPILALLAASPAAADWLVGRDGSTVETRGPWKVKRSVVVFTAADGTLSSLRLADVDLEASDRATAEAAAPAAAAPAPEPARRPPVLVLRTEDVGGPVADAPEAKTGEAAGQDPATPAAAAKDDAEPPPVEVVAWRQVEGSGIDGLEIRGTLRNDSPSIVTGAGVRVSLFDSDGELIGSRDAFLDAVSIAARATTGFRALFPGVEYFDGEPVFEVRARELELSAAGQDGD